MAAENVPSSPCSISNPTRSALSASNFKYDSHQVREVSEVSSPLNMKTKNTRQYSKFMLHYVRFPITIQKGRKNLNSGQEGKVINWRTLLTYYDYKENEH